MKTKRLSALFSATVLGVSSLLGVGFASVVGATAANCTWTGAGGDSKFSTATNWSNCNSTAPQAGDNLVFDSTSLSADATLNNDITGLSVGSVTFNGTNSNYHGYVITGNEITINGGVTVSNQNYPEIDAPITLGADQTFATSDQNGLMLGSTSTPSVLTLGTHSLTFVTGAKACSAFIRINDALSGSGNIVDNATSTVALNTDSPNYTGAIAVNSGQLNVNSAKALGGGAGSTTVASGATLAFGLSASETINEPLTLSGALQADSPYGGGCSGSLSSDNYTVTLSGAVTLQSDIVYSGSFNTKVTGTYNTNGHKVTVAAGSGGIFTGPDGASVSAPVQTITIKSGDNQPGVQITVGSNQTYIIDGIRGDVTVYDGGTLKGSGVVGSLVDIGGIVAPGHSPGCMSTGNLTLSGTYQAEIGGTTACTGYDQLKVTGTVTLGGTLDVSLYNNFKPVKGQTYEIISNDGTDAVSGIFNGLAEGATFNGPNGSVFKITYKGGDGNDVVLTTVTAPKTPDTGFALATSHPEATLLGTLLAAGAIFGIAQRTRKISSRR